MTRTRRLLLTVVLTSAAALVLAGCAGTVSMTPAAAANDPSCAAVTAQLPGSVAGEQRRWTDAQATGAWGSPTTVLLTCGVAVPGPSTLPCENVEGVDWLIDDSQAADDRYTFTTFGRDPAVQIYLDYATISSAEVLRSLSPRLDATLPETGSVCTARGTPPTP